MAMDALCSNEISNFILYDTAAPSFNSYSDNILLPKSPNLHGEYNTNVDTNEYGVAEQGRKKRRKRSTRVCKNKEEAESQRMNHIVVERNRRKIMNQHLAVLRSLMPESYVQRGDQASIVGSAIIFVKQLEHILQTLEAQKILQSQQEIKGDSTGDGTDRGGATELLYPSPFSQFFAFPEYSFCSQMPNKYARSKSDEGVEDIEVTLVESHANIRILCQKRLRQFSSRLISGFQSIYLTILHLNVTTLDPLVLYSISAKVEEGCQLRSADDIAAAVHQMLKLVIEADNATLSLHC